MKTVMGALIAILFAVSTSSADRPAAAVDRPSAAELGSSLMRVWQSGNVDELDTIMSPNSVYVAAQQGQTYTGLADVKRYVGHGSRFAANLRIDLLSIFSTDSMATIEWEMTGVQNHPIPGRIEVATGKEFRIRGATIVVVDDGFIRKATDYMDLLSFVVQLGARVELPGGVVMEAE